MGIRFWVLGYYDYSKLLKQEKIGDCIVVELREDPKEKRYAVDIVDVCRNRRSHEVQTMHGENAEYWFVHIVNYMKRLYEEEKAEGFTENKFSMNRRNQRNLNYT